MITRREFGKYSGAGLLVLATSGGLTLTGCNLASDIENWAPVGKSAFDSIVSLLQLSGLINTAIPPLVDAIDEAFIDLVTDARIYASLTPPPAGALAKLEEVFTLIVDNLTNLFSQLSISNPIVSLVIGLGQVIFSTIAGFVGQLPASAALRRTLNGSFRVGRQNATYTPVHRTVRQFKKDFNKVASAGGHPEMKLSLSPLEYF